jgi:hypothetical protein
MARHIASHGVTVTGGLGVTSRHTPLIGCDGVTPLQPVTLEPRSTSSNYGPFVVGISDAERIARCRALRTISVLLFGRRHLLAALLTQAERDDAALVLAEQAIDDMAAIPRRRLLCA